MIIIVLSWKNVIFRRNIINGSNKYNNFKKCLALRN